ncbi:unnamed protein product [Pedinophyceae sp. YPF-701]|nr:unnamed protein product [Pedinophyceae sp. YPF-701]
MPRVHPDGGSVSTEGAGQAEPLIHQGAENSSGKVEDRSPSAPPQAVDAKASAALLPVVRTVPDRLHEDLIAAAQRDDADEVRRLVREGADPNWEREDGWNAFYMAAGNGCADAVEAFGELRDQGVGAPADPQRPGMFGNKLFHFLGVPMTSDYSAVARTVPVAAKWFGGVGDGINTQASDGKTGIHLVIQFMADGPGKIELLRAFVHSGANLTIFDKRGDCPLSLLLQLSPTLAKELALDPLYELVRKFEPMELLRNGMNVPFHEAFKYSKVIYGTQANGGKHGGLDQLSTGLLRILHNTPMAHYLLAHPAVDQAVRAHWYAGVQSFMIAQISIVLLLVVLLTFSLVVGTITGPHHYTGALSYARAGAEIAAVAINFYFISVEIGDLWEAYAEETTAWNNQIDIVFGMYAVDSAAPGGPQVVQRDKVARFVNTWDATDGAAERLGQVDVTDEQVYAEFDKVCDKELGGLTLEQFRRVWTKLRKEKQWVLALNQYMSDFFNWNDLTLHLLIPAIAVWRVVYLVQEGAGESVGGSQEHVDMWMMCAVSLLSWGKIARYFLCFQPMGPLVVMVFLMLRKDLSRFAAILAMFFIGFSVAFFVLLRDSPDTEDFDTFPKAMLYSFFMILDGIADYVPAMTAASPYVGPFLAIAYALMGQVLLLNLLIAMMATSYSEVWDQAEVSWRLQVIEAIMHVSKRRRGGVKTDFEKFEVRYLPTTELESLLAEVGDEDLIHGPMKVKDEEEAPAWATALGARLEKIEGELAALRGRAAGPRKTASVL